MIFHGSSQVFVKHTTKKRKSENDHSHVKEINTIFLLKDFTRSRLIQYGTTSFLASVVFPDHPLGEKEDKILKILESHVGLIDGNGAVLEGIHSEVHN